MTLTDPTASPQLAEYQGPGAAARAVTAPLESAPELTPQQLWQRDDAVNRRVYDLLQTGHAWMGVQTLYAFAGSGLSTEEIDRLAEDMRKATVNGAKSAVAKRIAGTIAPGVAAEKRRVADVKNTVEAANTIGAQDPNATAEAVAARHAGKKPDPSTTTTTTPKASSKGTEAKQQQNEDQLAALRKQAGKADDGFRSLFDDPVLQKNPSAALALKNYLTGVLGPSPIGEKDLKHMQQQLQLQGYGRDLPADGTMKDPGWKQAMAEWRSDLYASQIGGKRPGSLSVEQALTAMQALTPTDGWNALIGWVTALPKAATQGIADVMEAAHIGQGPSNEIPGIKQVNEWFNELGTGSKNPAVGEWGAATENALNPYNLLGPDVTPEEVASNLGARLLSDLTNVVMFLATSGVGSSLWEAAGIERAAAASAQAGAALSKDAALRSTGVIARMLSSETGSAGQTAAARAVLGGIVGAGVPTATNALDLTDFSGGQILGMGLGGAFLGGLSALPTNPLQSKLFQHVPILGETGPFIDTLAGGEGLYYKVRTFLHQPYTWVEGVDGAGALKGAIGTGARLGDAAFQGSLLLGAGARGLAQANDWIAGDQATAFSRAVENTHTLDAVNDAILHRAPFLAVLGRPLDNLMFVFGGKGAEALKAMPSHLVGQGIDAMLAQYDSALSEAGWASHIEHATGKTTRALIREAGGMQGYLDFWGNKIKETAATWLAERKYLQEVADEGSAFAGGLDSAYRVKRIQELRTQVLMSPEELDAAVKGLLSQSNGMEFTARLNRSIAYGDIRTLERNPALAGEPGRGKVQSLLRSWNHVRDSLMPAMGQYVPVNPEEAFVKIERASDEAPPGYGPADVIGERVVGKGTPGPFQALRTSKRALHEDARAMREELAAAAERERDTSRFPLDAAVESKSGRQAVEGAARVPYVPSEFSELHGELHAQLGGNLDGSFQQRYLDRLTRTEERYGRILTDEEQFKAFKATYNESLKRQPAHVRAAVRKMDDGELRQLFQLDRGNNVPKEIGGLDERAAQWADEARAGGRIMEGNADEEIQAYLEEYGRQMQLDRFVKDLRGNRPLTDVRDLLHDHPELMLSEEHGAVGQGSLPEAIHALEGTRRNAEAAQRRPLWTPAFETVEEAYNYYGFTPDAFSLDEDATRILGRVLGNMPEEEAARWHHAMEHSGLNDEQVLEGMQMGLTPSEYKAQLAANRKQNELLLAMEEWRQRILEHGPPEPTDELMAALTPTARQHYLLGANAEHPENLGVALVDTATREDVLLQAKVWQAKYDELQQRLAMDDGAGIYPPAKTEAIRADRRAAGQELRDLETEMFHYGAETLGIDLTRVPHRGQDFIDLFSEHSKMLASKVTVHPDAPHWVHDAVAAMEADGYKPVWGTGIGHHLIQNPIADTTALEGQLGWGRRLTERIGLNPRLIDDRHIASRRWTGMVNELNALHQKLGRNPFPPGADATTILSFLRHEGVIEEGRGAWVSTLQGFGARKVAKDLEVPLSEARSIMDVPIQLRDVARKKIVEALSGKTSAEKWAEFAPGSSAQIGRDLQGMPDLVNETAWAAIRRGSVHMDVPLMSRKDAELVYQAIVKGSSAPEAYMVGASKLEDLFRASMGFAGTSRAKRAVLGGAAGAVVGASSAAAAGANPVEGLVIGGLAGAGATQVGENTGFAIANLPNRLVQLRNDLRFDLSPAFSMRRLFKMNVKLAADGIEPVWNPAKVMRETGTWDDSMAAYARVRPQFVNALGHHLPRDVPGTYDELRNALEVADSADRYLRSQDVFGLVNPAMFEAYAVGQWARRGLSDDEILAKLIHTFEYGKGTTAGRSALERTTNFFFFPFSFDKTLYRNIGGYLLDHAAQRLVLTRALAGYEEFNRLHPDGDNPLATSFYTKHLPILTEVEHLNAFAHGINMGEVGGINRPILNMFLPQSWQSNPDSLAKLQRFIPALKDAQRVWDEAAETGRIVVNEGHNLWRDLDRWFAGRDVPSTLTPGPNGPASSTLTTEAQQELGYKMYDNLASKWKKYTDYNLHSNDPEDKYRFPLTAKWGSLGGEPITATNIRRLVSYKYPAFTIEGAIVNATSAKNAWDQYVLDQKGKRWEDDNSEKASSLREFATAATSLGRDLSDPDADQRDLAVRTQQLRNYAFEAAQQDSRFYALYRSTWQKVLGPLERVK